MLKKLHYIFISAFAAVSLSLAAQASGAVVNFSGSIAAGPTFDRPASLVMASTIGTAVYFTAIPFTVDMTGAYIITQTTATYDGFLLEYTAPFVSSSPLTNLVNGDDDFDPDGAGALTATNGSQIVATGGVAAGNFAATNTLTAGTTYVLVSTTYSNGIVGNFTGTISGPGAATLVPEPGTWAMMGLGLLGGGVLLRRSRRTAA